MDERRGAGRAGRGTSRRAVAGAGRPAGRVALAAAVALAALAGGCGATSTSPAVQAADDAFLTAVHEQDPTINTLRSDTQLLRLGAAACAGFSSGVSFQGLADTMAVNDGNFPTVDLGTVITAAAENLCPQYRDRVE